MQHTEIFLAKIFIYGPSHILLVVALLVVAIPFFALLVFDIIRRRRRARRHQRSQPQSWRDILLKPMQELQALRNELKQFLRERARRERRRKRHPPAMPR